LPKADLRRLASLDGTKQGQKKKRRRLASKLFFLSTSGARLPIKAQLQSKASLPQKSFKKKLTLDSNSSPSTCQERRKSLSLSEDPLETLPLPLKVTP
jgi:hypothetical protein